MNENEIKSLLFQYRDTVAKLREIGVIRSSRVVSDYGEYVICNKFGLTRTESPVSKGYDATDGGGLKYEIKSRKRTAWNKPTLFKVSKSQMENADFFMIIEFDNDWKIVKLLKIPAKEIKPDAHMNVHFSKDLVKKYSIVYQ